MSNIKDPAQESRVIYDIGDSDGIMEQPIIVNNYSGSESVGIMGCDGEVLVPYRIINDLIKVLKLFKNK